MSALLSACGLHWDRASLRILRTAQAEVALSSSAALSAASCGACHGAVREDEAMLLGGIRRRSHDPR